MSRYRILYTDDEDDIREIAEMSLNIEVEFEVRTCSSGSDALGIAGEWNPHLILLDVMMPGMDGPATLESLRDNGATVSIPVVFITARTQPNDVERFMSLGAAGVIPKPFDPISLAKEAREFVEKPQDDTAGQDRHTQ